MYPHMFGALVPKTMPGRKAADIKENISKHYSQYKDTSPPTQYSDVPKGGDRIQEITIMLEWIEIRIGF